MICFMLVDTEEERDKLEALIYRYKGMMFCTINDIINDEHLTEDILQEVFIKIALNIEKVNNDINSNRAKSFIMTITKNTAFDFYRKNAKLRDKEYCVEEFDEKAFYEFDEESIISEEPENKIITVIKSLKEKYRDVLVLKYEHNFEDNEIAKALNITEDNVRQRISRGKKMIEEKLKGMGM